MTNLFKKFVFSVNLTHPYEAVVLLCFQIFPLWRAFSKVCLFIENNTSFFMWAGHENATKCFCFQMKAHLCGLGLNVGNIELIVSLQ